MTLSDFPAPAVVDADLKFAPAELSRLAARVAGGLRSVGVTTSDVVAWWLPNWWEVTALYLACWRIGAVAAPIHHRMTQVEAEALVARLRPKALLVATGMPHLKGAMTVRGRQDGFRTLLAHQPAVSVDVEPGFPAVVLTTSGSSGVPKLVLHTHRALAEKAKVMVGVHGLTKDDAVLMPSPMAHISGLLNGVLLPGQAGMRTVLMEQWEPRAAGALMDRHNVTFAIGPPTYFVQLMQAGIKPSTLRLISCGGAGVTESFARAATEHFDCIVKRTYGSTEAPTVTTSHVGDPEEKGWSTDGRAVGSVELRVVNGEIHVRGPELFASYDDGTGRDEEGWFHTGDTGTLVDGWLTVTGRLSDTIIRGGENVAPAEVEAVCARIPGIDQCVAIGYPDSIFGERIGLVVVGQPPGLAQLRDYCADAGLARFKWPDRVVSIAELPTLTVGKPDRDALVPLFVAPAE